LGVRVISEFGAFISETEVQAGEHVIEARRFVISTGSSPFVPPIPGLENVKHYTNEDIFDLRGSKVTVLEGMKAFGKDDPELAAIALKRIRDEGTEVVEGALASEISQAKGVITVKTKDGAEYKGSHLLMAVGRKANIDRLDLDKAGIKHDRAIEVDASMKTSNRKVYAIGDVAGGLQFTHVAGYHAGVIIRSALFGLPSKATDRHIPWATYTDPEMAQVGMTEAQARDAHGDKLEVARFEYAENDRARAELKTDGLVKVMIVKGRPVGASIVGAQAGELIQVWALAIANKMKMGQVAAMVAPYPTLGEVNKRAAGAYFTPRLFENPTVKRVVGLVQKYLP